MALLTIPSFPTIGGYALPAPAAFGVVVGLVGLCLYFLRLALLPKPIPGIPYHKHSARRLLGDVPDLVAVETGRRDWFAHQSVVLGSPIFQLFMKPLGRPWVVVSDFREAQDILMRRGREFDRSHMNNDSFGGVVPNHHITMRSADPRFKGNKELVRDLMTPQFLNEVSAPQIYDAITKVVKLWGMKADIANGRPFEAAKDFYQAALDIIMAVAFDVPADEGMMHRQLQHLAANPPPREEDADAERPVPFGHAPFTPELEAAVILVESLAVALRSPLPVQAHFIHRQKPFMRRAISLKDQMLERNIQAGVKRIEQGAGKQGEVRCAVDHILLREKAASERLGVKPHYNRATIKDELFGYIVGGHDTTSTTLAWWFKFMAAHQPAQARLRRDLRAGFPQARAEHRLPTAAEIAKSHVPYLDAVIEETLRHSRTLPVLVRQATVDTYVLGHRIPKGTNVVLISHGPGFLSPGMSVDEEKRTETSRHAKDRYGVWSPDDVRLYRPERWLKMEKQEHGGEKEVFDAQAGPQMPFGLGPRGCFGRRLAYLEMRIVICLLIWSFEFGAMGEELNNMTVVDKLTSEPKDCYVRLKRAVESS